MVLSLIFPCAGAQFRDSFLAWRPIASPGLRLSGAKAYVRCPSSFHPCLVAFRSVHHRRRPRSSMVFVATAPVCVIKVPVPNVEGPDPVLGLAVTQPAREASLPDPIFDARLHIRGAFPVYCTQEDHVGGSEARLALQEAWTRASTRCFWKSWYGEMAVAPPFLPSCWTGRLATDPGTRSTSLQQRRSQPGGRSAAACGAWSLLCLVLVCATRLAGTGQSVGCLSDCMPSPGQGGNGSIPASSL